MKKDKFLIIQGELWPNHIFFRNFDFINSKFISFYTPLVKENPMIHKLKIFTFNEKFKFVFFWPFKFLRRTYKIIKIINKFKPNIIITHHDDANISILLTLFIQKKILKKKMKFIAYIHNGDVYQQDNFLLKKIIPFVIKKLYKNFDKIITVSYGNKIYLDEKFKLKKVEVIYNPIDLKGYLKLGDVMIDQYSEMFDNNSFKFITIGRLSKQKNLFNLLKVFSELIKFDVKLYILGDGELNKQIKNKIKEYNLEKKVILLGFQDNVFKFIKNCDSLILNSYWESFGQVLTEALIFNKIIISTDCKSGPREILCPELNFNEKIKYPYIGKFGILIKPYDLNLDNNNSNIILKCLLEKVVLNKREYSERYSNIIIRAKCFDKENIKKITQEKLK